MLSWYHSTKVREYLLIREVKDSNLILFLNEFHKQLNERTFNENKKILHIIVDDEFTHFYLHFN